MNSNVFDFLFLLSSLSPPPPSLSLSLFSSLHYLYLSSNFSLLLNDAYVLLFFTCTYHEACFLLYFFSTMESPSTLSYITQCIILSLLVCLQFYLSIPIMLPLSSKTMFMFLTLDHSIHITE